MAVFILFYICNKVIFYTNIPAKMAAFIISDCQNGSFTLDILLQNEMINKILKMSFLMFIPYYGKVHTIPLLRLALILHNLNISHIKTAIMTVLLKLTVIINSGE